MPTIPPDGPGRGSVRLRRVAFWVAFALAAALLVTASAASVTSRRSITNAGTSMENTLRPGDKLLYVPDAQLRRGDLVLERVPSAPQDSRAALPVGWLLVAAAAAATLLGLSIFGITRRVLRRRRLRAGGQPSRAPEPHA